MTEFVDVVLGGTVHAAVLFLVAAGLQLVFGVKKIFNLACGSFYALGAYFGITAVGLALKLGMPPVLFLPVLILAGLAIGLVGLPIERVLRTIYRRDESYQLLITFGFLLMFQDVVLFLWHGEFPRCPGADLQSAGHCGQHCHRNRARPVSRADQDRAYRARHGREPR